MKWSRALPVAGALLAVVASAACPPAAVPCSSSDGCPSGEVCVEGSCRHACNSSAECGAGERCRDGACVPVGAADAASDATAADRDPADRASLDRPGTDRSAADRASLDGAAGDASATDAAASDRSGPVDAVPADHMAADRQSDDTGAIDSATGDASGADVWPWDAWLADGWSQDVASGPDAWAWDSDLHHEAGEPDVPGGDAGMPDASADSGAGDGGWAPEAGSPDRTLCLPGFTDLDGDGYVGASVGVVCFVDTPPDGVCVNPVLQVQRRPRPGTASASGGGAAWNGPENIHASDDVHASVSLDWLDSSEELRLTDLGFALPSNATITGIVVEIERSAGNATPVRDAELRLLRNGNAIATNKAASAAWPTTDTLATYGSPSDLWGRTWSISDVNGSGFGVTFTVRNDGSLGDPDATARVDAIHVSVHYRHDCDDNNAAVQRLLFADGDGDGYGVGTATCVGGDLVGWTDRPGDCDDDKPSAWRAVYRDSDGDGYGAGPLLCVGDEAGYSALGTDCLDSKPSVRPGQSQYFTAHRGDGSFDYNCDGVETPRASCLTTASLVPCQAADILDVDLGWVGTVPGCGATGTYRGCVESPDAVCSDTEFDGVRACSATQDCSTFSYNEIRDFVTAQPCH